MDMVGQKVFCVGLGKTGTTTFGVLMRRLGRRNLSGPVGVMLQLLELGRTDEVFRLIDRFDSFDDFPYPRIYRDCAERYPAARFVLTRRRTPETWLESLRSHNRVMGPTDAFLLAYDCYAVDGNESHLLGMYERHLVEVREFFAGSGRMLEVCWEDGTGVGELAGFLGVPAGRVKVPTANAAADRNHEKVVKRLCDQQRFGAAARYARSTKVAESLLQVVNRRMDARLKAVEAHLGVAIEA